MRRVESVLFVTTSHPRFKGDFAGVFVQRLAKYLVRNGLRVTVLAPASPGYPTIDEIDGVQIQRFSYFHPKRLQRLAYGEGGGIVGNLRNSWLAKVQLPFLMAAMTLTIARHQSRFDLVHCHWLPTAGAALLARYLSRHKRPIVLTNWGSDTRNSPSFVTRSVVSRVEGCISPSVETENHLRAAGRRSFVRIWALADEETFDRDRVNAGLPVELGLEPNVPIFLFVGRLDSIKDPLTFIRACAHLRDRGLRFYALVLGDGPLMAACRDETAACQLAHYVRVLGMRPDPERAYRVGCLSVHVSPIENVWAGTIVEAMQMGVPVVLSDAGLTSQFFGHEKNCLIVPSREPEELAQAMERLLNSPSLRQRLSNGGFDLLAAHDRNSSKAVSQVRNYYDSLL